MSFLNTFLLKVGVTFSHFVWMEGQPKIVDFYEICSQVQPIMYIYRTNFPSLIIKRTLQTDDYIANMKAVGALLLLQNVQLLFLAP